MLSLASLSSAFSPHPSGSLPFDEASHTAVASKGCGSSSPYTPGRTTVATGVYAGVKWTYRVYVPKSYTGDKALPIIVQHPGWGMNAKSEESGAGITLYADEYDFISVTAQGMDDNTHYGGPWYSWNAAGTSLAASAAGPTCTSKASTTDYCYTSCTSCPKASPQCGWTTCDETVTPSGTGTKNVGGFIPGLFDTLESQLCIDTTREYAAGESNGGIQTYQLGVDLASRLAAIAPQFGSFARGFNLAPSVGVPVLDLHGSKDTTVPGNVSLSGDGYYYTTTTEIFHGNEYSRGWVKANGCSGSPTHYPTRFDGGKHKFWCASEGICAGGDVIRCSWNGGHNWLFNDPSSNGGLVTEFLLRWTKTTHVGMGATVGELVGSGSPLADVRIVGTDEGEVAAVEGASTEDVLEVDALDGGADEGTHGHYGDPDKGCLAGEAVLPAGTGRVCAPKIAIEPGTVHPPTPKCELGGVARRDDNGCPLAPHHRAADGGAHRESAFPVCLAKGNLPDPYDAGSFHCLLVCPCLGDGSDCGKAAHASCPGRSRCERGELRHRAKGVCTYHGDSA